MDRKIFATLRNKDQAKPPKRDFDLSENIYGAKTAKQYYNTFHWIHFVFKYKFFVPLVLLANNLFGKHLIKEIPDKPQFEHLQIFDDAYEEAMEKWYTIYIRGRGRYDKRMTKKEALKNYKNDQVLRVLKQFVTTVCAYDTAYLEFLPFFEHAIQRRMNEYNKRNHLMYTHGGIFDARYFALYDVLKKNSNLKHFKIVNVGVQRTGGKKNVRTNEEHCPSNEGHNQSGTNQTSNSKSKATNKRNTRTKPSKTRKRNQR